MRVVYITRHWQARKKKKEAALTNIRGRERGSRERTKVTSLGNHTHTHTLTITLLRQSEPEQPAQHDTTRVQHLFLQPAHRLRHHSDVNWQISHTLRFFSRNSLWCHCYYRHDINTIVNNDCQRNAVLCQGPTVPYETTFKFTRSWFFNFRFLDQHQIAHTH